MTTPDSSGEVPIESGLILTVLSCFARCPQAVSSQPGSILRIQQHCQEMVPFSVDFEKTLKTGSGSFATFELSWKRGGESLCKLAGSMEIMEFNRKQLVPALASFVQYLSQISLFPAGTNGEAWNNITFQ